MTTSLAKKEKIKSIIPKSLHDPDKIASDIFALAETPRKDRAPDFYNECRKKLSQYMTLYEHENHNLIAATCSETYKPLTVQMCRDMIKEFKCTTTAEKALVEILVGAYIRYLEYSARMSGCLDLQWHGKDKNGYYAMLSKEVDRASRQYISALTMLKQMKMPPVSVSVNTNAAFMSLRDQKNSFSKKG